MIKTCKSKTQDSRRTYVVRCDCQGRTGRWACENWGPPGGDREEARDLARASGWITIRCKWYCPDCQRDGLTPNSDSKPRIVLQEMPR
jgi:hypothetical protein